MARTIACVSQSIRGLKTIELENDWFRVTILPEIGAKLYDLIWKWSGRNYLWHNQRIAPRPYPLEANFDNYWCGGWDDAFPTCDACDVRGEHFPNLGELRSVEWETVFVGHKDGNAIAELVGFGPISPVQARKIVVLKRETPVIHVHFELRNLGPMAFDFTWGTHPAIDPGESSVLRIPAKTGIVDQSSDSRLGLVGQHYPWPYLEVDGNLTDVSRTLKFEDKAYCRHFATDLTQGCFAVEDVHSGSGLLFAFPPHICPHLQLWLVYGGWRGHRHVIVEPWTSLDMNLANAIQNQTSCKLVPGHKFEVDISTTIYEKLQNWQDALMSLGPVQSPL